MPKAMAERGGYTVRNHEPGDTPAIAGFNQLLGLQYQYHPDFRSENIFCAVGDDGTILGVAHLEYTDTWLPIITGRVMPDDFIHKLRVNVALRPGIDAPGLRDALLDKLLERARTIRADHPDKRIRVHLWIDSTDNAEMDYYLSKGFTTDMTSLVMKRDLTREIPAYPAPDGITTRPMTMESEEERNRYYAAELRAFEGVAWTLNHVGWMRFGPEWLSFGAFAGDELVGHCMTWMITEERSATEDVFVVPEWQGRGVSKAVLSTALRHLKEQGKSIATLSVHGTNKRAISLYGSMGYEMYYVLLDFGLDA